MLVSRNVPSKIFKHSILLFQQWLKASALIARQSEALSATAGCLPPLLGLNPIQCK